MKAEIITIGDEILLGQIQDSNSRFIGQKLAEIGIDLTRITAIGDGDQQIVEMLREALTRCEIVITTGGLGPTEDDLTKQALCHLFGRKLIPHPEILSLLVERYQRRGMIITDMVKTQADLPDNATLFPNPIGSAVGILLEERGRRAISLPGVPLEMKAIMENSVIPYLQSIAMDSQVILKNILTFGTFESYIARLLGEKGFRHDGCQLAYLPSLSGVILRLTYKGPNRQEGERLVSEYTEKLKQILAAYYVCDDGRNLVEVTADLLKQKRLTVAVAESCTGGMIAAHLTDIPGSSFYLVEGMVTYSNEAKIKRLGVPVGILAEHGAVSEQTARAMAEGMRALAESDYALAVTGIAGPSGGTEDKPVGLTYIALADEGGTEVHRHVFGRDRQMNRERTVYHAINYLRLKLLHL